jgi:hypothetical protein
MQKNVFANFKSINFCNCQCFFICVWINVLNLQIVTNGDWFYDSRALDSDVFEMINFLQLFLLDLSVGFVELSLLAGTNHVM